MAVTGDEALDVLAHEFGYPLAGHAENAPDGAQRAASLVRLLDGSTKLTAGLLLRRLRLRHLRSGAFNVLEELPLRHARSLHGPLQI